MLKNLGAEHRIKAICSNRHLMQRSDIIQIAVIPAARYYYGEPENESVINSVNASEHSVSCVNIFRNEDSFDKVEEVFNEETGEWEVVRYLKS